MSQLSPTPAPQAADFADILTDLAQLSRNHLVFFRLEVGRLLLHRFYGGDVAAYQSKSSTKPNAFGAFTAACAADLAELGLSEQTLRQCLVAHIAVSALPAPTVHQLGLSQVVELARVSDAANRRVLAQAAVDNHWTGKQIKQAAAAVAAGRWIDGDPATPGLQPPALGDDDEDEAKKPQQGRVVRRFEKAASQLGELQAQFAAVAGQKLSARRRARLHAALDQLQAQIDGMRGRLGAA